MTLLCSRLAIFECDIFFKRRDFIPGFKPKLCHAQRDRFLLLKTTSVELEGRAGQHGVCVSMGSHGGADCLELLWEGREQEGSWGQNFCQAQMKL